MLSDRNISCQFKKGSLRAIFNQPRHACKRKGWKIRVNSKNSSRVLPWSANEGFLMHHWSSDVWCTRFPQFVFYLSEFGEMQYTVNLTTISQQRIPAVFLTNQLSNYRTITISCARLDIVGDIVTSCHIRSPWGALTLYLVRVRSASRLWRWTRSIVWRPEVQRLVHFVRRSQTYHNCCRFTACTLKHSRAWTLSVYSHAYWLWQWTRDIVCWASWGVGAHRWCWWIASACLWLMIDARRI